MIVDSMFCRGSSHAVCEDYAMSGYFGSATLSFLENMHQGTDDDRICSSYLNYMARLFKKGEEDKIPPAVIVSDGCSASPFTDFGARMLTVAARRVVEKADGPPDFMRIIVEAHRLIEQMGLKDVVPFRLDENAGVRRTSLSQVVDATLGLLIARPNYPEFKPNYVDAYLAGDGVFISRERSGGFEVVEVTYSNNTPAYLSYLLSPKRCTRYLSMVKNDVPMGVRTVRHFIVDGSGAIISDVKESQTLDANIDTFVYRTSIDLQESDIAMVATDGLSSFMKKDPESGKTSTVPLQDVVEAIVCGMINMNGPFIQRFMKRFLGRTCDMKGWWHYDDIAIGGIYCREFGE